MSVPMPAGPEAAAVREFAAHARTLRQKVQTEISRIVVGMEAVCERLLVALLGNGLPYERRRPPAVSRLTGHHAEPM